MPGGKNRKSVTKIVVDGFALLNRNMIDNGGSKLIRRDLNGLAVGEVSHDVPA